MGLPMRRGLSRYFVCQIRGMEWRRSDQATCCYWCRGHAVNSFAKASHRARTRDRDE
jgi:hypothetical protein